MSIQVGTATTGGRAVEQFRESLRPIAFGTAYKVFDLFVEHVLRANGARAGRLSFVFKHQQVLSTPPALPAPLDGYPGLWERFAALYRRLDEVRHALVHRKAGLTARGDLEAFENGVLINTVTAAEVAAFISAVHAMAELVVDQSPDGRRLGIVAGHLNTLGFRHRLALLPVPTLGMTVRLGVADLQPLGHDVWRIDVAALRAMVSGQVPSYWDLKLYAGGRIFVGRWEDIPDPSVPSIDFPIAAPPAWLCEQLP